MTQFLLTNQLFPSNISFGKSYGQAGLNNTGGAQQINIITPDKTVKSVNIFENPTEDENNAVQSENVVQPQASAADEVVCSNNNAIIIFLIIIIVIILITIILMSVKLINYGNRPVGYPLNNGFNTDWYRYNQNYTPSYNPN